MVSQFPQLPSPIAYLQFASLCEFAAALLEEECFECRVSLRIAGAPGILHINQLARREMLFTAYSDLAIYWFAAELSPEPFTATQQFNQLIGDVEALGIACKIGRWSATGPDDRLTQEGPRNAK